MLKGNTSSSMPVVGSGQEQPRAVKCVFRATRKSECSGKGICTITSTTGCYILSQSTGYRLYCYLEKNYTAPLNSVNLGCYPGSLVTRLLTVFYIIHLSLIICAAEKMKRLSNIFEAVITPIKFSRVIQTKEVDAYA